jgi:RNA polymerase sigma-70 factor (ECF subfamily)
MPRFEKRSSFLTWLIRIVINEALARLKNRKRFASITYDYPDDAGLFRESPIELQTKETPIGTLMNTELHGILEKAVDRLPDKYRTVFLMREIEGMSVAETSESLEISETNVKVRLNRAKEMLRESISGFYHDVEVFQFDLVRCDRIVKNVLHRLDAE